jgi:hypothetical protein
MQAAVGLELKVRGRIELGGAVRPEKVVAQLNAMLGEMSGELKLQ